MYIIPAWHHLNETPLGGLKSRFLLSAPVLISEANKNTRHNHILGAYSKAKKQNHSKSTQIPNHNKAIHLRLQFSRRVYEVCIPSVFSDLCKVPPPVLATERDLQSLRTEPTSEELTGRKRLHLPSTPSHVLHGLSCTIHRTK